MRNVMKLLVVFFIGLLGAAMLMSNDVEADLYKAPQYQEAYEDSAKTKKPFLVVVTGQGCPPCNAMKTGIKKMTKAELGRFNLIIIDYNSKKGKEFQKAFGVKQIPTTFRFERTNEGWAGMKRHTGYLNNTKIKEFANGSDRK